jgi:hypothetical protein
VPGELVASGEQFKVGGQVFTPVVGAPPDLERLCRDSDDGPTLMASRFDVLVALVAAFLVPEDRDRWRETVRTLPAFLIPQVADWLIDEAGAPPLGAEIWFRECVDVMKERDHARWQRALSELAPVQFLSAQSPSCSWRRPQGARTTRSRRHAVRRRARAPGRKREDPHERVARAVGLVAVPGGRR